MLAPNRNSPNSLKDLDAETSCNLNEEHVYAGPRFICAPLMDAQRFSRLASLRESVASPPAGQKSVALAPRLSNPDI